MYTHVTCISLSLSLSLYIYIYICIIRGSVSGPSLLFTTSGLSQRGSKALRRQRFRHRTGNEGPLQISSFSSA